jgi:hypothetical protein
MSTKYYLITFLIAITLLLNACASTSGGVETSAPSEPSEYPATTEPVETSSPTTTPPTGHTRPDTIPITTEPLLGLQQRLADDLGFGKDQIELVEMRAETWSDGCLGAALPGEMCTMAIVPGYLLVFQTPNGKIEVHTDEAMRVYRLVTLLVGANGTPLVSWNRSGGIEGICWQMHIYMDASYRILNCFNQQLLSEGSLSQQTMDELLALTTDMAPHEWITQGILGADMFVDSYTWFKAGSQVPEAALQEQLNSYLGSLASQLIK